ncbi:MAG: hypothetical protein ABEI52_08785, partial [Halobacteriaceae archaeon]
FYQVGKNDELSDREGGWDTQVEISKRIFDNVTPKSFWVIDDLIEGTTFEEKTEQKRAELCSNMRKAGTSLYISHHHQLTDHFLEQDVGQYWQVLLDEGGEPTYKFGRGVSRHSHAKRVTRKVGHAPEDMRETLVESGYMDPDNDLLDVSHLEESAVI